MLDFLPGQAEYALFAGGAFIALEEIGILTEKGPGQTGLEQEHPRPFAFIRGQRCVKEELRRFAVSEQVGE